MGNKGRGMKLSKWLVSLGMGLAMSAVAVASFPSQNYIDELNKSMREEVERQATQFDEDGLRVIAMNVAIEPSSSTMTMAMGMMVSDAVTADRRQEMLDELDEGHFDLACGLYMDYLAEYGSISTFNLHFVVVTEDKQLLYDHEKACTEYDVW